MSTEALNETTTRPVPPVPEDPTRVGAQMEAFVELVSILRRECPWDKKQTHETISHLLIEEAYETVDAIKAQDDEELKRELGDLLLHVVMHSVMAEQRGAFSLIDVVSRVSDKLVHRHPHVFGDTVADDESTVKQRWEQLKMKEGRTSVLEGVPSSLPALLRGQRMQEKAANYGFDWSDKKEVWKKVDEELQELRVEIAQGSSQRIHAEFGDLIFSIVNAARFEGVVAEDAMQSTNKKFDTRFRYMERRIAEDGNTMSNMTLAELDVYWNESKTVAP